MNTSASTTAPKDEELWTVRNLLARHRWFAVGVAVFIAVMLAMVLFAVFGAKAGAITDSTTCTGWSSANQARQIAYGKLYLRERGALPSGGTSPAGVVAAINTGCTQAFSEDVDETTTVVQAISGNF